MQLDIRTLGVKDARLLIALRREALETEPLAFAASPADDVALVMESVHSFLEKPAKQLYEAAGFRAWGAEPRALRWNERFMEEHHLALDLSTSV